MQKFNKAWVALIGSIVTIVGPLWPALADAMTPEVIQALGVLLTAGGVYAVRNAA